MTDKIILPVKTLRGTITVPGDKSITHRAILLSAIASGCSIIINYANGQDCLSTLQLIKDLGVNVEETEKELQIYGVGKYGLKTPTKSLNCGNSGTTMRLAMGLLSGANIACQLIGDSSLSKRPMLRIAEPLMKMGAQVSLSQANTAPVQILPHYGLQAIHYPMPVASAQVKSAILLAGLYSEGNTSISESAVTRDHTECLFRLYGIDYEKNHQTINLIENQTPKAINFQVPGDFSSAAFWIVAGLIVNKAELTLEQIGLNPTRTGMLDILRSMGADLSIKAQVTQGEAFGTVSVRHSLLKGICVPKHFVSLAIDEFPILFVAAACATGKTEIRGLEELRIKETDRIGAMVANLTKLGVKVIELDDGVIIEGGDIQGGIVDSFGDHRIAMAMAIAALVAKAPVTITNIDAINISYPAFFQTLNAIFK